MRERKNSAGFTLIELAIASLIGMLAIAGSFALFNSQHQSSLRTDDRNDLSGTVNVAMNLMTRHIRMAGYGGVGWPKEIAISPINNVKAMGGFNTGTSFWGGTALAADMKTGTDAFLVLHTDNTFPDGNLVQDSKPFDNDASGVDAGFCQPNGFTSATNPYQAGDIGIVIGTHAGGTGGFFVKITDVDDVPAGPAGICSSSTSPDYSSVTYQGLDELNLPVRFDCQAATTPCVKQSYFRLETAYVYYIDNQNRLKRATLDQSTFDPSGNVNPQVIAEGVEDLQIHYNLMPTCDVTYWGACSGVNAPANPFMDNNADGKPDVDRLTQIRSMQLGMVFRSLREDKSTYLNKGKQITLTGFDHTAPTTPDSYRRTVATQTIRVKNLELMDF